MAFLLFIFSRLSTKNYRDLQQIMHVRFKGGRGRMGVAVMLRTFVNAITIAIGRKEPVSEGCFVG